MNSIVQLIFPEAKKHFNDIYGESALAVLKEHPSVKKLTKAHISKLASLIHGRCKYTTEQLIGATRHSIGLYRGGLKLRIGFIASAFQRTMSLIRFRKLSPSQTRIGAQGAPQRCPIHRCEKSILLFVSFNSMKGFCMLNLLLGDDSMIPDVMTKSIVYIDSEIGMQDKKIKDLGAIKSDRSSFHAPSVRDFYAFISDADFVCGHNIVHHDLVYLTPRFEKPLRAKPVDTLYLSPLVFPCRPYHRLLKDDKLQTDQLNNPLNDAEKAMQLLADEVNAFLMLSSKMKQVYCCLLYNQPEFKGFFDYVGFVPYRSNVPGLIREAYDRKICAHADVELMIQHYPIELAYALALISAADYHSVTPPWLTKNYPKIDNVVKYLCHTPCKEGCAYCHDRLNIHKKLKQFFGYDKFRTYAGEPLQERAAQAAIDGKSLLAVFPTGGGKSITFQLPALMAGECAHGLTVVISPLQSLMKDQVDNLNEKGLVDAVTVNGLLSPIERAESLERVASGLATLLYISPEQLRSTTIEKLLLSRNVVRFVIDEAHCFSAWGQDFRVDYLYIGDFIREYQKKKQLKKPIPVSCFTATAKQKVITDICDYFRAKLDLPLELFTSTADRENLHYTVLFKETDEEKYNALRSLIEQKNCPTIVYVSRTRRTIQLAEKLTSDGFPAKPFNGKMDPNEKVANQEAFINNQIKIMVATSAFGMGVDKKDVKLVIHYDISDSLENYVQEAGRAGRDPSLLAECFVLYNDNDLDKHFMLLNQTKLSISEIQQVWKALKDMTREKPWVCCSALEIARQAGWDDSVKEIETRVKTAVAALENAGYVKRGRNVPHVYATSILAKDMAEASFKIERSPAFYGKQKENAKRIIKSLISSRSIATAGNDDAESRVDYLADMLGIPKEDVVASVNLMRQEGLLADSMDMSAYILKSDTENRSAQILNRFAKLEEFLLNRMTEQGSDFSLKEINEAALDAGIAGSSVKNIRTLLYYLTIKGYISKGSKEPDSDDDTSEPNQHALAAPTMEIPGLLDKFYRRIDICRFLVSYFYDIAQASENGKAEAPVQFSLVDVFRKYTETPKMDFCMAETNLSDVEDALLYLSKIGSMRLEGGFLVLYNGMEVKRMILDNKIRYKAEDYRSLSEYYKQKIQQIHIVGEYANLMVKDYNAALQFVHDYFEMDFKRFIAKYFKGERAREIDRNITPEKYHQLFGELSDMQSQIINNADARYIVVAAGPGSGKTRVLVHKLASLLLLEDVKHEQLLMLTFSRAAATEFKKRLMALIGNAANFVEIKTFHSYCFDLLGKIGSLEGVENVVHDAARMIANGEVEQGKITKSVLVIDEAQDMDANEFTLIRTLMQSNDDMRVIAVGDDDQNIYEFRGSNSAYMQSLIEEYGAVRYELVENYRSKANIVTLANRFAQSIEKRMKQQPIKAVKSENGTVQIVRHTSDNMEEAIVRQLIDSYHGGKTCVLTGTNEEALRVLGSLLKNGVRAKLIQSIDGFRLYNLAEVRYFLRIIDKNLKTPVIGNDLWKQAKTEFARVYSDSACLENVMNMISDFEKINSYSKYRTDLEEFIKESQFEDFYTDDREMVFVSTIHKSKGREFESVWLLLNHTVLRSDADRRRLYVGMTRAKDRLYIHCNNDIFDGYRITDVEQVMDETQYPEPKEITLQLTHKDVVLDFFKDKKELIFKLHSGMELSVKDGFLYTELKGHTVRVAKFSKSRMEELDKLFAKGYLPCGGEVRFVVAWKGENDPEETAVLLPSLHFKKDEIVKQ